MATLRSATLTLNAPMDELNITITHNVVDPTAAFIHTGSPGTNGPVVFNLGAPFSVITAVWNNLAGLSAHLADLTTGNTYFTIHTAAFRPAKSAAT